MLDAQTDRADKSAQPGQVVGVLEAFRVPVASLGAGVEGSMSWRGRIAAKAVEVGIVPAREVAEGAKFQEVEYVRVEERFLEGVSNSVK